MKVKLLVVLFILLTFWWRLSPMFTRPYLEECNFQFASIYFVVALFGGVCGLFTARRTFRHSSHGRAQLFFAIGLLFQVFGQVGYLVQGLLLHQALPYPSVGDIGYAMSIPSYFLGCWYLAQSVNVNIWLQSFENRFQAVVLSIMTLIISYGLFLHGYIFDSSNPVKILLDLAYPLTQAACLCVLILTHLAIQSDRKNLMRSVVLLALLSLIIQFLADFMFSYEVSRGTWIVGANNDYLYLVAYFVMSFTVLQFDVLGKKKPSFTTVQ